MLSDIDIAQSAKMKPISEIAEGLNIGEEHIEYYGKYKAKLMPSLWQTVKDKKNGKLVLVTAITPTPAGEGKTTVSVSLAQSLCRIGKKAIAALREPSLGPVMGIKGGAAGGGYAQIVPMEDLNLHFTGDLHAVTAANNLLSALVDNHLQQGNKLNIDPRTIVFKRVLDLNDRALRDIVVGLGGKANGVPREDGFMITAASEIMAVLCLSSDLDDMKKRFSRILIGYNYSGEPVIAGDLKAEGAMTALMKYAIMPNLVQTLENTPCLIHGGPFANIAHGCNSVVATKYALKLSDICVTEAGFGADLGAEKFLDIKCRSANLIPDAAVLVATVRALKHLGGAEKTEWAVPNTELLVKGLPNLEKHIENLKKFGLPVLVAINKFEADTDEEINAIKACCAQLGVSAEISTAFSDGGAGAEALAYKLCDILDSQKSEYAPLYSLDLSLKEKLEKIACEIYGADGVDILPTAQKSIEIFERLGYGNFPVCVAKTQYSLSDNPLLLARPKGFRISVREVKLSAGAGFIVALTGAVMTMPGLPRIPAAEKVDIDNNGNIKGLF